MSDDTGEIPLTYIKIDGKIHPVYPPTSQLWSNLKLAEDALKTGDRSKLCFQARF